MKIILAIKHVLCYTIFNIVKDVRKIYNELGLPYASVNKTKDNKMENQIKNKNIITSIFGYSHEWSIFEKIWLTLFTIINTILVFTMGDNLLGFIASMSGMLCVVLVAKGKISNYLFGLIQVGIYGYVALKYQLYGEVMLNWMFYVPVQFIGFYLWNKNGVKKEHEHQGEDIAVKTLGVKNTIIFLTTTVILIILLAYFLKFIGGYSIGLDSATTILSIGAQILMLLRYKEQWLVWIIVNVLSITMWIYTLIQQGGNDWNMVVMWTAFLCNSIYGYINWTKMNKAQMQEEENV